MRLREEEEVVHDTSGSPLAERRKRRKEGRKDGNLLDSSLSFVLRPFNLFQTRPKLQGQEVVREELVTVKVELHVYWVWFWISS